MSVIRKLFVLSTVAAAVALTACGGGDDPVQTAADVPKVTVSPANLATAKAATAALVAAPAITLPAITPKEGPAIAAGTSLKFTAAPAGSDASTLSGFTMTSGTATATGVMTAGSCRFTVTGGTLYTVGQVIVIDPCEIDLATGGASATTTSVTVALNLGGTAVTTTAPVTVTITGNTVTVSSGGTTVTTGTLSTGS